MRLIKTLAAGLAMAVLLSTGVSFAAADMNEVGALLVYPVVTGLPGQETFLTVTNAAPYPVWAHVSMINGDEESDEYCYECDFKVPLSANDTETLVLTGEGSGIAFESEDGTVSMTCNVPFGFVIVTVEVDPIELCDGDPQCPWTEETTVGDNILFGSEVVIDYDNGYAYSIPAIPFQGNPGNSGDRRYGFGTEYEGMPRYIAADFIAPDAATEDKISADIALFSLYFFRQEPPHTDCSVIGWDADEHPFSDSIQFGCWTLRSLESINPEFTYPNLGQLYGQKDTHGWFTLDCSTYPQINDQLVWFPSQGTVHGAIIQKAVGGSIVRRETTNPDGSPVRPEGPSLSHSAAWARLFFQSRTTHRDDFTLWLEDELDPTALIDCNPDTDPNCPD